MMKETIVQIEIEKIYPHPDNPRKDIGDITELSESIKKNGIMQNLTVIKGHYLTDNETSMLEKLYQENPDEEVKDLLEKKWTDEGYTLIIGHRRCAAAKMAGIKELPCRIIEGMTKKEQVSTMLEENMQRNDLTIYEQAQGFQMMLDLGETEDSIAEKTGFSKGTVKHRINIAKLDQEELRKKTNEDGSFQLSLKDLYELEKIKDIETRNKVLKKATDSRDLLWKVQQEVREEKKKKNLEAFKKMFTKAGIKKAKTEAENERYSGKWDKLQEWDLEKDPPKTLKKFEGENIQWVVYWGATIAVIAPAKKKEKKLTEYEIREQEKQKAKKEIRQKSKEMYKKANAFILGITNGDIQPLKEDVALYQELVRAIIEANISFWSEGLTMLYSGKGSYNLKNEEPEKYEEFKKWEDGLTTLHRAIAHMSSIDTCELYNYNAEYHKENAKKVNTVFGFLKRYGFSVSEEEEKLLNGTHELYKTKEEK